MSNDLQLDDPNRAENKTLIDSLLEEQRRFTAVESFAQRHADLSSPLQERYYRDLIPLTQPVPGEQYGFEVDLDACSGCKACVTACHSLNGLDEGETWRSVGVLVGGADGPHPQRTVTTACHHCVDPACLNGCPVLAYEKDPSTGIVRHLDDQCIGCQYCILKCPYDVPQYSSARGIVRKCDMCRGRLAEEEAPACVQACPNRAISVTIVSQQECFNRAGAGEFLPDSPDPAWTLPTTLYRTATLLPANLRAGDHFNLKPQAAHLPLVFMLVFTQLGAGLFLIGYLLSAFFSNEFIDPGGALSWTALGATLIGINASVFHLGRPWLAWRSFLGWRRSWLSREVICFGLFSGVSGLYALSQTPLGSAFISPAGRHCLEAVTVLAGLLGVFTSVMVYHDTGRQFWRFAVSGGRFFGTTLLLGFAFAWVVQSATTASGGRSFLMGGLLLMTATKLSCELSLLRHLQRANLTSLKRTARLLTGELRLGTCLRFALGIIGGFLLPLAGLAGRADLSLAILAAVCCLVGELLERYLFFRAVAPPTMPGGM